MNLTKAGTGRPKYVPLTVKNKTKPKNVVLVSFHFLFCVDTVAVPFPIYMVAKMQILTVVLYNLPRFPAVLCAGVPSRKLDCGLSKTAENRANLNYQS